MPRLSRLLARRLATAAATGALLGAVPTVAHAQTAPEDNASTASVGVKFNPAEHSDADTERYLSKAQAAGVRDVIVPAAWWSLCPTSSRCDFTRLSRGIDAVRAHGMTVTVQLLGTADWAHEDLAGRPEEQRRWTMPRDDSERRAFGAYVGDLATTLKGRVARYEVWNEPDLPQFSGGAVSADTFARTVASAYGAVKHADPQALVTSGGLSRAAVGYASRMLDVLDSLPGSKENGGYVDEIGIHPYSDDQSPLAELPSKVVNTQAGLVDFNFLGYRRIEALLDSHGRTRTKVWLGEVGYSTTNTWMSAVPDWRRAAYLVQAAQLVRQDSRVSGLIWFGLTPGNGIGPEWSLLDSNGATTQTFDALALANGGTAVQPVRDDPACSVTRVERAAGAVQYPGWCLPSVAGRQVRYDVYIDGVRASSGDGEAVVVDPSVVRTGGQHTLSVASYGRDGLIGVIVPATFERRV